jgi:hypothetical protein
MTSTKTGSKPEFDPVAEAMDVAGRRYGFGASLHKLAGAYYVVTRTRLGDAERAYLPSRIDVTAVSAPGWDYVAWRATTHAEDSLDVAVCHFMATGRSLARGDGSSILRVAQYAALKMLADGKPCRPDLPKEQLDVLAIAKRWGWSPAG